MLTASWRPALIALNLLLLGMIALFAARIVSALVAARLAAPAPRAAAPATAPAVAPASVEPESAYAVIAERDVFNAVKRAGGSDDPSAPAAYKRTDLNLKLWGTAIAHEPSQSFAIIEDQAARRQMLYRVGDTVLEVATLARVEWDRVVLSRDGEEEVLEISGYYDHTATGGSQRRLRQLLNRMNPTRHDATVWLGIFRQILWKLRQHS